jgi:hypothetical protein
VILAAFPDTRKNPRFQKTFPQSHKMISPRIDAHADSDIMPAPRHKTLARKRTMSYSELNITTLSAAKTMTRSEVEAWIAQEENTTVRIILWRALNE